MYHFISGLDKHDDCQNVFEIDEGSGSSTIDGFGRDMGEIICRGFEIAWIEKSGSLEKC